MQVLLIMIHNTYKQFSPCCHWLYGLFFLSVLFLSSSCGLFSGEEATDDEKSTALLREAGECSTSRCVALCDELFSADASLLSRCLEQDSANVDQINSTYRAMDRGNWEAIKPESLKTLIEFDDDIWPEFARVNDKLSARDMLFWVAEEKEVSALLDDDNIVLKNAFSVLGAPVHEAVLEGMTKNVDEDNDRVFFQVSVINNNEDAFKSAHELLKEECDERTVCIKQVYCDINEDIVFGKLNELGLGQEVDSGGLYKDACGN